MNDDRQLAVFEQWTATVDNDALAGAIASEGSAVYDKQRVGYTGMLGSG